MQTLQQAYGDAIGNGDVAAKAELSVMLIDDDDDIRASLVWLLRSEGLSAEAFGTPQEMLSAGLAERPGCLLLDLRLPSMNGLELQRRLVEKGCRQPFIVLSGNGEVSLAVEAMRQGALDFIEKPFHRQRLLDRIWQALEIDTANRRDLSERRAVEHRLGQLSPREHQVLRGVVRGMLSKEIARQLGISTKTIEVHRSNIMRKMRVDSLALLVSLVTRHSA